MSQKDKYYYDQIRKALSFKYDLKEELGKGGMAYVFKANQRNLDREIALKVIYPNLIHDDESVSRFRREARSAASLMHPNIVFIIDEGQQDNVLYIAMEYLDGENLHQYIRKKGKLNLEEVVAILCPIAQALEYIHHRGYVHRDVKSSNIIITKEKRPVLTDFGITHAAHSGNLTMVGTIMGTPEYMSPEQAQGLRVDRRSDIFSLGIVLFHCLTGSLPFRGETTHGTIQQIISKDTPDILHFCPDLPVWIKRFLEACLMKDPDQRIQSGAVFSQWLKEGKDYSARMEPTAVLRKEVPETMEKRADKSFLKEEYTTALRLYQKLAEANPDVYHFQERIKQVYRKLEQKKQISEARTQVQHLVAKASQELAQDNVANALSTLGNALRIARPEDSVTLVQNMTELLTVFQSRAINTRLKSKNQLAEKLSNTIASLHRTDITEASILLDETVMLLRYEDQEDTIPLTKILSTSRYSVEGENNEDTNIIIQDVHRLSREAKHIEALTKLNIALRINPQEIQLKKQAEIISQILNQKLNKDISEKGQEQVFSDICDQVVRYANKGLYQEAYTTYHIVKKIRPPELSASIRLMQLEEKMEVARKKGLGDDKNQSEVHKDSVLFHTKQKSEIQPSGRENLVKEHNTGRKISKRPAIVITVLSVFLISAVLGVTLLYPDILPYSLIDKLIIDKTLKRGSKPAIADDSKSHTKLSSQNENQQETIQDHNNLAEEFASGKGSIPGQDKLNQKEVPIGKLQSRVSNDPAKDEQIEQPVKNKILRPLNDLTVTNKQENKVDEVSFAIEPAVSIQPEQQASSIMNAKLQDTMVHKNERAVPASNDKKEEDNGSQVEDKKTIAALPKEDKTTGNKDAPVTVSKPKPEDDFTRPQEFSELAAKQGVNGLWGFVLRDDDSRWIINPTYKSASNSDYAITSVVRAEDGKTIFINAFGRKMYGPYDKSYSFKNGWARVVLEGKYGYLSARGEEIACQFIDAENFTSDRKAWVKNIREDIYWIDETGMRITK